MNIYNRYTSIILFFLRILSINKRVKEVLIIVKAYAVVVAGISVIMMWNDRNSMVFYGEDNFCDDSDLASETGLQNGTVHIFYLF